MAEYLSKLKENSVYTSNFASIKKLEAAGLTPLAIAIGRPKWYKGLIMDSLAPTWDMLKAAKNDPAGCRKSYDAAFKEILWDRGPNRVLDAMGNHADMGMLCWEKAGEWCHRRLIADWLETKCGLVIPEFGYHREGYPRYKHMPSDVKALKE